MLTAARGLRFAEQARLRRLALGLLGALQRASHRGEQAGAIGFDRIESAGANQRLHHAPVDDALVDPPAEIEQVGKRRRLARLEDRADRRLACAAHRAEAVADRLPVDRHEAVFGGIDLGRQDSQAVGERVLVQLAHLVGVVHHCRKVGRHERRGVMRFHVCRLIREQRVGRGVRLVEAVAGELLHQIEQLRRLAARQAVLLRARNEDVALLGHLLGLFLAHRAAQQIGAAQRVAADDLRDLHHLLLVNHDAVGRAEDRL